MFSNKAKSEIKIISDIEKINTSYLNKRGYSFERVGWDDCCRGKFSTIGSNISDWTFKTKNKEVLPFIRSSNYEDKTLTIKAKDVNIVINSENVTDVLEFISAVWPITHSRISFPLLS